MSRAKTCEKCGEDYLESAFYEPHVCKPTPVTADCPFKPPFSLYRSDGPMDTVATWGTKDSIGQRVDEGWSKFEHAQWVCNALNMAAGQEAGRKGK